MSEIDVVTKTVVVEIVERGPAGASGDSVMDVPDNHLPMALGGELVDSNLRVEEGGTLVVGLSSIQYGEAHKAGSAGENVVTTNLSTGFSYHPVWQTLAEGNTATVRVRGEDLPPITISADVMDLVNPVWSQGAASGNQTVRSTKFIFAQAQTRVRIGIALDGIEVFSTIIPSVNAGEYTLNYLSNSPTTPSGIDLKAGQVITASVSSIDGDVVVRGDNVAGEYIPYQVGVVALWEDKTVALVDDISKAHPKSGYVGGDLPIIARVSPTEISIGGGTFSYRDLTDPLNPVHVDKVLDPIPVYTMVTIPPALIAYIYVDVSDMSIKESALVPAVKPNSWVYLGNVDYDSGDILVNSFIETAYSVSDTTNSLLLSRGDYNLAGCDYYGVGGLSLGHSEGLGIRMGSNTANDPSDPDRISTELNSINFVVRAHTNTVGDLVINTHPTDVDPTKYSDAGVLKSTNPNKWTVQYLYHFYGSDVVLIYYGTNEFNDVESALASIVTPSLDVHQVTKEAALRSVIVIRGGATDLTNTADAIVLNV